VTVAMQETRSRGRETADWIVPSAFARVVWASAIDIVGVFGIEGLLELFCLVEIKLFFGRGHGCPLLGEDF